LGNTLKEYDRRHNVSVGGVMANISIIATIKRTYITYTYIINIFIHISSENKKRILIVDDDSDITVFFKLALNDAGFDADVYNDPIEALSNFKRNYYDLLLIDIRMPRLNGFELVKKLKKKEPRIKVCFITSFEVYYKSVIEEHPSIKNETGCFIKKPISSVDLIGRIRRQLDIKYLFDFTGLCTVSIMSGIVICKILLDTAR